MGIDHGLPGVELLQHWLEHGVTEIFAAIARHQADAFRVQRIGRVRDFVKAAFGVRQWNRGKRAKASRVVSDEPCRVVVRVARELAAERHVAECEGRRGKRIDSDGDPTLVHVLERLLHRPWHLAYAVRLEGRCIRGRYEVMMDVDAVRLRARSTWGLRIRRTAWN